MRTIRTEPLPGELSPAELKAQTSTRAAINSDLLALITGEREALPMYQHTALPGVTNPPFADGYAAELDFIEEATQARRGVMSEDVYLRAERAEAGIVIPPDMLPVERVEVYKAYYEQHLPALKDSAAAGECLWFNRNARMLAGITEHLRTTYGVNVGDLIKGGAE